ncbi:kinase-like domain-containing protein [Rhizophagus clarus]|uniref:Kinase-like domain-containing protein n=1 Tax=Rhizophagus clarus TaxID=94130 RepID=A0A8H3M9M1_9GLOM|nr:kinase-like domain-containing protein [Rhizophagus clarus]
MSKKFNKNFKNFRNNNSNALSKYGHKINKYGLCFECNRPNTGYSWCKNCNSKKFQQDFDKWTSGNKFIDKFIKVAQLKAENQFEVIEWIPYNRLRNIKYLAKGGFSTIYKAIWLDGYIDYWDIDAQTWDRHTSSYLSGDYEIAKEKDIKSPLNKNEVEGIHVALKSLNNSSTIDADFLNELKNHVLFNTSTVVRIYGITQDPETSNYMIVMELMKGGNLRSNLLIKKYNPFEKYENLVDIARVLLSIHKCNLIHGDFHSGNILLLSERHHISFISDFGLSRPVDKIANSNEIYGVIPYLAPEVLRGKPYTKAADIYSFGIIMWEFTSGVPAFNNRSHDFDLSLDICKGSRPKVVEGTLPAYARLMKRCWDSDPNKRPSADELVEILTCWFDYYPKAHLLGHERTPVPSNEPITKNHPLSCYTSRKINYSAKLNEILNKEELSAKYVIVEEKEFNYETSLSESLESCMISNSKMDEF